MARFALFLNGKKINSIEDLRENYDPQEVLDCFKKQSLQQWLRISGLTNELETIQGILVQDDDAISQKLMECFQISNEIKEKISAKEKKQNELLSDTTRRDFFQWLDNQPDSSDMIKLLRKNAELGDAAALVKLGWCYEFGKNLPKDVVKAVECYKGSAQKENPRGEYAFACCLASGQGIAKDMGQAISWWQKSAEHGNGDAMACLGQVYCYGIGTEKNIEKGIQNLKCSVLSCSPIGQYELGRCYQKGIGVQRDSAEVFSLFELSANKGYAPAMTALGELYATYEGMKNIPKAIALYQKAIQEGNTQAKVNLARHYEEGDGILQDLPKAIALYQDAADAGNKKAFLCLGRCYQEGKGVAKDLVKAVSFYEKANLPPLIASAARELAVSFENGSDGITKDLSMAVKWYKKAAEAGDDISQRCLGNCYLNGTGIEKAPVQAVFWYRKAAEQGDSDAQCNLGWCYGTGTGVEQNAKEAIKWYQESAEKGNMVAQYNLGFCYENGQGVDQDFEQSKTWYQKAAEQGYSQAKERLESLSTMENKAAPISLVFEFLNRKN